MITFKFFQFSFISRAIAAKGDSLFSYVKKHDNSVIAGLFYKKTPQSVRTGRGPCFLVVFFRIVRLLFAFRIVVFAEFENLFNGKVERGA